ncbi:hypothetical protein QF037_009935 [Streptomyces canus]|nr:hypothetical protein [Streptomyces canus]
MIRLASIIERVHDSSPSKLVLLRFLERVQERDLARTRRWIVDEERREAERRRGIEARPPVPDWLIEQSIGHQAPPVYVHVGGCHMAGKRSKGAAREQAVRALTEGVDPCPHCRPDTDLGILD